jgi:hypothetical protein
VLNRDDISGFTTESDGSVSAIALKSGGKQAYKFEVGKNALNSLYNQIEAGIINGFAHGLTLIYPQDDQTGINQLGNFANGSFIVVVNKRGSDGNGTFRLLGKTQGLVSTSIEGDDSNSERSGLPFCTLGTDPDFYESLPPVHFFDSVGGTYASTLALLEGYLTPTA